MTGDRGRAVARLLVALAAGAVAAGLVAAGLTSLLHLVQHLAFGYEVGPFADGVLAASPQRRVLALVVCGVVAGAGWYALGRWLRPAVRVRVAVRERSPMRPVSTTLEGLLQIVVVGLGASLGRESAPRRIGGAAGDLLARALRLDPSRTALVVACAAGAGFGAVYDVPVAGALFTLEVLLRSRRPTDVVAAAAVAAVATVVASVVVPAHPIYSAAVGHPSWPLVAGAVLAGPVGGGAGWLFAAATSWAGRHRATGWAVPATAVPVFTALGVLSVWVPSLLGNGRGPATLAFAGERTIPVLLLLALGKPLVTAACLRTGATGGLVTPAFATGALLGAGLGGLWVRWWPGEPAVAPYAVVVAGALLTVTMRAPLTATALVVEITGVPLWFVLPAGVAVAGAWVCTRGWRPSADLPAAAVASAPTHR